MIPKFEITNEYLEQYLESKNSRPFLCKTDIGENHHVFPKSIFGNNDITIKLQRSF